jgi:hypothetical protein
MPDAPQRLRKWRVGARVVADTERELGSLPMVLLTPVIAAVFATVVAVHEPSTHVHDGVVVGPSLLEALRYAVEGALGSILFVVVLVALLMWLPYRIAGDPVWKAVGPRGSEQGPPELWYFKLRRGGPHPADPGVLGALEFAVRMPSGSVRCAAQNRIVRVADDEEVIARSYLAGEPGDYHFRWYAVPDGKTMIEVGRGAFTFREARVDVMADEVKFARPDGSMLTLPYDGDLLVADAAKEALAIFDDEGQVVVITKNGPTVLDDEIQLTDHLSGSAYQEALNELRDARARRRERASDS